MTSEPIKRPVGRPRKSETYVKRSIRVYLPDMAMVGEWKALAKENKQSISKFVIERVEDSIRNNGEGARHSRKDLIDRNINLEQINRELRKDMEIKTKAYEALENELQTLRVQPFLNPMAEGMRRLSKDLIELFTTRKRVSYDELLPALGIKPMDIELVKGINTQIEALTHYGLIKSDLKGWRWLK